MSLRTLLVLGRVSNLPTVWSNLLAGWLFNFGLDLTTGNLRPVATGLLLLGGSLLYIGGMYLNDYCDAAFDARYCPQRPIPAGKISRKAVGLLSVIWFVTGFACLAFLGIGAAAIATLLIAVIVLYDFHHKGVVWAPVIMGACRFLLYLLAACAAQPQSLVLLPLNVLPPAVAMAIYVAGITYVARGESRPEKPTRWALVLLLAPFAAAWYVHAQLELPNRIEPALPFILFSLLLLYWMAWMFVPFWRKTNPSLGRVVSGLLAGIVLVDMLMLTNGLGPVAVALAPLFALALLLQRFVPAT